MFQNYSLFIIIVEKDWFSKTLEKLNDYQKKVILSHNISYYDNFNGMSICVMQGDNLDLSINCVYSEEKYMEDAEVLEQRDRVLAEFERELFKDPTKIICETFDN